MGVRGPGESFLCLRVSTSGPCVESAGVWGTGPRVSAENGLDLQLLTAEALQPVREIQLVDDVDARGEVPAQVPEPDVQVHTHAIP